MKHLSIRITMSNWLNTDSKEFLSMFNLRAALRSERSTACEIELHEYFVVLPLRTLCSAVV